MPALWRWGGLLLPSLVLLVAIASRIALLAYIEATSFEGLKLRYLAPAHPIVLAFSVLMLVELGALLRVRKEDGGRDRAAGR